jgi:signal transduction histidine kinase
VRERRFPYISIRGPVILLTVVLVLIITLTVLWNVVLARDYRLFRDLTASSDDFHTSFIALGSALFLAIIVLSVILGTQLIASVRWRQRQSRFLASVSHELNSPLSAIKLFAQTLRKESLTPEERSGFVGKIVFDVDRLAHMIANILRAAEFSHRGEELSILPSEVNLHAYLREYVSDAATVYSERVDLSLEAEEEVWVEIDPMMFRQVLDNLVDNAIRYRGNRPAKVRFLLTSHEDRVELDVSDEGVGIPAETLDDIFERFYRIEGNEPPTGRRGMGIGLNVVRSIVRGHGGSVVAYSDGPGQGALFRIRLPAMAKEKVPA